MKKIILGTALILLVFSACNDNIFKKNLKVSHFEVKPLSQTVPAEVLAIVQLEGKEGGISYSIYYEGAYSSLEGTGSDTIDGSTYTISFPLPNGTNEDFLSDTIHLFYRNSGSYEIKLEVLNGDTFSESFTLSQK